MASRVKAIISERDGTELEYREELNPFNDLLQVFGILCNEEITLTGGYADPSVVGFAANIGSVYFCGNGNIYKKFNIGNTDWELLTVPGTSSVPKWDIPQNYTQTALHEEVHNLEGAFHISIESNGTYQLDAGAVVTI